MKYYFILNFLLLLVKYKYCDIEILPSLMNCSRNLVNCGYNNNYPVQLNYNYIIPKNRIKTFFNDLIYAFNETNKLSGFFNNLPFLLSKLENINNKNLEIIISNKKKIFENLLTNIPFNLFIGPVLRDDKPKNSFDKGIYFIIGKENSDILRKINFIMNKYNKEHFLSDKYWKTLDKYLVSQIFMLPVPLNPSNWIKCIDNSYIIKKIKIGYNTTFMESYMC